MSSVRRASVARAQELSSNVEDPDRQDATVVNHKHNVLEAMKSGDDMFHEKHYAGACAEYTKALHRSKECEDRLSVSGRVIIGKILSRRAVCFLKMGKFDEAISDADDMLKMDVGCEQAYMCKAMAQQGKGDIDGALLSVRYASRHAFDKSHCIALHASLMKLKGNSSEVSPVCHHTENDALEDIMNMSVRSERSQEVVEDVHRAVNYGNLTETSTTQLVQIKFRTKRGEALSHIGRFKDALRDVDAVLAAAPNDDHAVVLRIQCLVGLKEYTTALNELKEACKKFPQNEHLRDLLIELTAKDLISIAAPPASPIS